MESHRSKTTRSEHMETFYKTFPEVKDEYFDGMIITGAPVEHLPLRKWTIGRNSVRCLSGLRLMSIRPFISVGGAQAGLYLRYGVEKYQMDNKLSGIYPQDTLKRVTFSLEVLMIAMYPLIHGIRRFLRKRS